MYWGNYPHIFFDWFVFLLCLFDHVVFIRQLDLFIHGEQVLFSFVPVCGIYLGRLSCFLGIDILAIKLYLYIIIERKIVSNGEGVVTNHIHLQVILSIGYAFPLNFKQDRNLPFGNWFYLVICSVSWALKLIKNNKK